MPYLFDVALFILGAIVASFASVVVARLHTGESFISGRSRCDACAAPLPARSLAPVFSHLLSFGRARCCGARLSPHDPLGELILGALFVLAYHAIGVGYALPLMLAALAVLFALVRYDINHQILPTSLLGIFIVLSALTGFALADSWGEFYSSIFTAVLLALFLGGIHILSRGRAMGFADAPFVFGCALLVGQAALPGFIFSFWIGAAVGIFILVKRPRGSRMGVEVPFAPFLAAGFLLAYFTQWNPFIFAAAVS